MRTASAIPAPRRTTLAGAAIVVSTIIAVVAGAAVTSPTGATEPAEPVAAVHSGPQRVMLLTGDQVLLDGDGRVAGLLPAPGREDIPAQIHTVDDRVYVVPQDALGLIERGDLDPRLFDVTELGRAEYDRLAGHGALPVIVSYDGAGARDGTGEHAAEDAGESGPDSVLPGDVPVRARLESINAEALTVDSSSAPAVWEALTTETDAGGRSLAPGVSSVLLDGIKHASGLPAAAPHTVPHAVPASGIPPSWDPRHDGAGVTIAVLDTGIDTGHPDLAGGKVAAERNFTSSPGSHDRNGHGTHVASVAAGTGEMSDGAYAGVAPGATLLNGKVLGDDGYGLDSAVIQGMEWAVAEDAQVVNMSLSGGDAAASLSPWHLPGGSPPSDAVERAIDRLSAASDTLFVTSAGNGGPGPGTLGSPGGADAALTVGAVTDIDEPAEFSASGPRAADGAVKPDLTAPGVDITAAAATGSTLAERGEPVDDGYVALSGTSTATPHVAGAAALVAQEHPGWDGERIKQALVSSATSLVGEDSAFQQGAGRVGVGEAIGQTVLAETPSLTFGTAAWPHRDDEPVTRELTYRNLGTEDVTLELRAEGHDPAGEPEQRGVFSLSAETLTVPAGETASVTVTADASRGSRSGAYSLHVTAVADNGQTVRTTGALTREPERHDLTVEITGADGRPATGWSATAYHFATGEVFPLSPGDDGAATVRMPPGQAVVFAQAPGGEGATVLSTRGLDLTENTALSFDVRQAEETELTLASPQDATPTTLSVTQEAGGGAYRFGWLTQRPGDTPVRTQHTGGDLPADRFRTAVGASWRTGGERPALYHASYPHEGALPTGFHHRARPGEFAEITLEQGSPKPGATGRLSFVAAGGHPALGPARELPATGTVHVTGGRWSYGLYVTGPHGGDEAAFDGAADGYEAGRTYERTVNTGVFGPAAPASGYALYREGDELTGVLDLLADGQRHHGGPLRTGGATRLTSDGETLATVRQPLQAGASFGGLPEEETAYELSTTVRQAGSAPVSREISLDIHFTSARPEDGEREPVPFTLARFTPRLGPDSTAPAGERTEIPVSVEGPASPDLASLTVEVSFDGGETWREVPVRDGAVTVRNPEAGGSVSLRAEMTTEDGTVTTQTIIAAYRTA